MSNMIIWDKVSTTETSAIKRAKVGGQEISSINGYSVIQKATEIFGPIGIGWGYTITDERLDDGKPFGVKQEDGSIVQVISKTHTIKINFWYVLDGNKGEFEQFGHTPAIYRSSYGVSDDSEAPKKSLTDAIKKSLSFLGFNADVFLGMFDDAGYVQQLKTEEEISESESKAEAIDAKKKEFSESIKQSIEAIKASKSEIEVNGFAKVALRKLESHKKLDYLADICEKGIVAISRAAEETKTKLKGE